ncbi:MAG: hypothetical protein MJZ03_04765 [archaeon]|nr:hypothetical protein [archaeon]
MKLTRDGKLVAVATFLDCYKMKRILCVFFCVDILLILTDVLRNDSKLYYFAT